MSRSAEACESVLLWDKGSFLNSDSPSGLGVDMRQDCEVGTNIRAAYRKNECALTGFTDGMIILTLLASMFTSGGSFEN